MPAIRGIGANLTRQMLALRHNSVTTLDTYRSNIGDGQPETIGATSGTIDANVVVAT